jgi:glycosyltransferase involved in cell wall biosynthesis
LRLESITPLVLTYNEEPNIARALAALEWASQIVVVDSFSTDRTLQILEANPRVEIVQRPFDDFAGQCNAGLEHVRTEWVLSLDADYICPPRLADELRALPDEPSENGFQVGFRYCIDGKPLRASLYPPRTVLYRKQKARYERDGHAHRVRVDGQVGRLATEIDHDDRKPLDVWFGAQARYARQEATKLHETPRQDLNLKDRLRLSGWIAPILTPIYCLIAQRGLLDGRAGWFYAMQRTYAEIALALQLHEHRASASRVPARRSVTRAALRRVQEPVATSIRSTRLPETAGPAGG